MRIMIRAKGKLGRKVISSDEFLGMLHTYKNDHGNLVIPVYYVQDGYELGDVLFDVLCRKVEGMYITKWTRARIFALIGDSMEELKKYYAKFKSYNGIIL